MTLEEIVPILQLSVGPVIVISGVGLVVLSMTNRYGRVIDRSRILSHEIRHSAEHETHRARAQLQILMRRVRVLRLAIALATLSMLLAASLVITLFVIELLGQNSAAPIIVLFMACMASLIFSLVAFLVDINLSLGALIVEVDVDQHGGASRSRQGVARHQS